MKNLKSNLNVKGIKEYKEKLITELKNLNPETIQNNRFRRHAETLEERIERLSILVKTLKENDKKYIDDHRVKETIIDPEKENIYFVLLNAENVCPVYAKTYCCLNEMYVEDNKPRLSQCSVGPNVKLGNIKDLYDAELGYINKGVVEEIDIDTFNVEEYFRG